MRKKRTMNFRALEDSDPLYLRIARLRGNPVRRSGVSQNAEVEDNEFALELQVVDFSRFAAN
jgi:hypothetical protein